MQTVDCYNCGSHENEFYASENGFDLVKCSGCGLLFVNPRPTDEAIEQAHKIGVHSGTETLEVTGSFNHKAVSDYMGVLEDVFGTGSFLRGKTWLDIGCGHGEFLVALDRFSDGQLTTKGVEPNVRKQELARNRGLNVSFFDLEDHADRYDVVSFLNVYSHLPDPSASIRSWKRLLNPGGELVLETGDTANFDSKDLSSPQCLVQCL